MAKSNKNTIIGIVVAVVVVIIAIIIGINVGGNNTGDGGGGEGGQTTGGTDYSNVDVSVEFGDYDGMFALSKSIQNGEATGEIVKVDGIVSHPLSTYSVVQEGEDGNKIGTEFIIEGVDAEQYPEDGTRVIITGEVVEKSTLYYVIKTTPEHIDVLEIVEDAE